MVDLRSDTVTRPTGGMKKAMFEAQLGDDVLGDDPTVKALEARSAELTGKEAAIFVPSGTMANQIAIMVHTRPGDEVLMEAGAHPFNYEAGGPAVNAGVQVRPLPGTNGQLDPKDVALAIRPVNDHFAPVTLLCVENTSNRGGGSIYPIERIDALTATARANGLKAHLDGARVFNAVVATKTPVARIARDFDTLSFCLSKGLGCPVGSLLCGSRDDMQRARRVRKWLGGGMRQSGFLAAAGLYALEHRIDRLDEDHQNARELSMGLMIDGFDVQMPETNMVYVNVDDGPAWQEALDARGVRCFATAPQRLRLVLHLDVDKAGVAETLSAFKAVKTDRSLA